MAIMKYLKNLVKMAGPSGGEILNCKFSMVGGTLTVLEAQGCTVAKGATGVIVITTNKTFKVLVAHLNVERVAAVDAQTVRVVGSTTNTITLNQFTSASGALVESLTFTAHVSINARANS